MNKYIFFIFCTLLFLNVNGQQLVYKSGGKIYNAENKKLSPDEVRKMLSNNEELLSNYNEGRSKKTIGNILLIGGFGLLAGDLLLGLYSPVDPNDSNKKVYPSGLTYVGLACVLVSIPVKIGYSKKIKKSVEDYNKLHPESFTEVSNKKLEFIANANGLGMRFTLD